MSSFAERLHSIRERIARAAERSERDEKEITLLSVSKTHPQNAIQEAVDAGITCFGESRVQEALTKIEAFGEEISWHFIGHLQKNKVKKAVGRFALIHAVDSLALAERIDRIAGEMGVVQPVLIEVNISREPQKHGVTPEQAEKVVTAASAFASLHVQGLMGMAPYNADPEAARPFFKELKAVFDQIAHAGHEGVTMMTLSTGMSGDFEVAIEEGATIVRVGSALFGARQTP